MSFSVSNLPPSLLERLGDKLSGRVAVEGRLGRILVVELLVFGNKGLVLRRLRIVEEIVRRAVDALRTLKAIGRENRVVDGRVDVKRDGLAQAASPWLPS